MLTQLVCHSFTWGPSGLSEGHTGCWGFKAFFRVFTKCGTCPSFSASDSTMTLSLLTLVSLTCPWTCLVKPSCTAGRPCLQEPGNSGAHPLQISAHPVSVLSSGAWQTYYQVLCACYGLAPARCSQVESYTLFRGNSLGFCQDSPGLWLDKPHLSLWFSISKMDLTAVLSHFLSCGAA